MTQADLEATLHKFERLVTKTAHDIVEGGVELEFDDVAQILRVKVWQAVQRFDATRVGTGSRIPRGRSRYTPLERFVFGCVLNLRRDIEKRPRHYHRSIDALREEVSSVMADRFDARYLSVSEEEVFAFLEQEIDLPETLTEIERQVVMLRLEGLHLLQIDRVLGLSRAQRERVMRSVREKFAHLDPSRARALAEIEELPPDEPEAARPPAALAA